jgi:hypothetical protein
MTQDKYDYSQQEKEGKGAEEMYKKYLTKDGWSCRKTKGKNPDEPFDYEITDGCWGDKKTIEIKSYGRPELQKIFAETVQVQPQGRKESTPEYLTYPDKIDEMIYVDQINKKAFVYDMKKFAEFVEANKGIAVWNSTFTAKGVVISEQHNKIGYIKTIDL